MKNIKKVVIIITLLIALLTSVRVVQFSANTIVTAIELAGINDSIRFYNEQMVKTDRMTKNCEELFKLRQEKFYNSEDLWGRLFSNMSCFLKIMLTLVAIGMIFVTGILWTCVIVLCIKLFKRILLKKKRRKLSPKGAR